MIQLPRTRGELRASGWRSRSVKDELRANLIERLSSRQPLFPGIVGFDGTVLPQIQNALLSRHDFILLGLRGQAKTRILRALTSLLDEHLPVVEGCEIRDDPLAPLCAACRRSLTQHGDDLPVRWIGREERYSEKLATPDVTVSDLIGDIDPIKAARRQLDFADPEVIHYGLVPRANRGVFAVNELPDLAARIQVGLLNVLEEGDVQIRGFPVRLPLDLLLVFSANPEDYTHRGSIITPLRDRIASQILTHYPRTIDEGMAITAQESWSERDDGPRVVVPELLRRLIEGVAFRARESEFVDQKSGVSARMTIALLENVISNAERRAIGAGEDPAVARIGDVYSALSAIGGKIELVYDAEREGLHAIAVRLIGESAKAVFDELFPDVYGSDEPDSPSTVYGTVLRWFRAGGTVELSDPMTGAEVVETLGQVAGLEELVRAFVEVGSGDEATGRLALGMELALEGLHQASVLARAELPDGWGYGDMLAEMARSLEDG